MASSNTPHRGHGRESRGSGPVDAVAAFRASMPARYRESFDGTAIREHAAIVARRDGAPAHVEIWRRTQQGGGVACVVADDRPGLLSLISATLVAQSLDVVSAQAYTRTRPEGGAEAVDFLWLRRDADHALPVRAADATSVTQVLSGLLTGARTVESVLRSSGRRSSQPPAVGTRVTFNETPNQSLSVLTVETFDRPGLLLAITLALFHARVQIVSTDAETTGGRVVDRFQIVELDGSPIVKNRRGAVQTAVLAAIDTLSSRG
jgi:[protein-PII] uridylyltransferase